MKYLNQLEYSHIPYPTDVGTPDSRFHSLSIKEAGCGLCCLAMMIDQLTNKTVSLKKLISLSVKHKANLHPGTDMKVLGPVVAGLYDLDYSTTNSIRKAVQHLKNGGSVIANVGGDREGYTGVFSHGGHYILLLSAGKTSSAPANTDATTSKELICVLDPSLKDGKYDEPGREGKVLLDVPFAYCSPELLEKETDNRNPGFYLFSRKIPE